MKTLYTTTNQNYITINNTTGKVAIFDLFETETGTRKPNLSSYCRKIKTSYTKAYLGQVSPYLNKDCYTQFGVVIDGEYKGTLFAIGPNGGVIVKRVGQAQFTETNVYFANRTDAQDGEFTYNFCYATEVKRDTRKLKHNCIDRAIADQVKGGGKGIQKTVLDKTIVAMANPKNFSTFNVLCGAVQVTNVVIKRVLEDVEDGKKPENKRNVVSAKTANAKLDEMLEAILEAKRQLGFGDEVKQEVIIEDVVIDAVEEASDATDSVELVEQVQTPVVEVEQADKEEQMEQTQEVTYQSLLTKYDMFKVGKLKEALKSEQAVVDLYNTQKEVFWSHVGHEYENSFELDQLAEANFSEAETRVQIAVNQLAMNYQSDVQQGQAHHWSDEQLKRIA